MPDPEPPVSVPLASSPDTWPRWLLGAQAYAQALQRAGGRAVLGPPWPRAAGAAPAPAVSSPANAGEAAAPAPPGRLAPHAVSAVLYAAPPYDLRVPALPVSRLSITLTAARVSGALEGDRRRSFETRAGALFLTPAGAGAQWRKEAPSRHLNLYFHADALAEALQEAVRGLQGEPPLLNLQLPGVRPWVAGLHEELRSNAPGAAEAVDSLGRLLLIRLARHLHRRPGAMPVLSAAQLARVREHVQAHLAEPLLVPALAAAAGLPPNRFALAFAATTGQTPHQFVIEQRLQAALATLRQTSLPLAEVAAACGFASQQHLTQRMRQRLGTTPARYRRARAGR